MSVSRGVLVNGAIAVLALASVVAVIAPRNVATTGESEGRQQNLLQVFRSEDATRVELTRAGQKLAFERAGSDGGAAVFRLVEPVKELADAATVDKFLSALADARTLRAVDRGPALSTFGLDKPQLTVKVKTDARSYDVALGGPAPTPAGARYALVGGSVVVLSKSVADDLSVELEAFRLRSLVSVNEAGVTRITIKSPTLDIALKRKSGTNFVIEGDGNVLADRDTLKSLFFQLGRLSATRFLAEAEATSALGSEHARFELTSKDAPPLVFEAGGSCPGDETQLVVVRRAPDTQSGCAPRELEATLQRQPSDFFDRHPFSLHTDEVEELDIAGGKQQLALVRKGSGFVLHASTETQVELEAGNQRILDLLEAQGERVSSPQLAALGLEPARATITLRSSAARDSDVVQQVVRVGTPDESGALPLLREQDSVVLRVPREQARAFAVDSTLLYARKLTEFGLSSFQFAEVEWGKQRQVLRRNANQELRLEEPKGFDVDGSSSADLIQALGALTAERFVADRDDHTFGLEHPSTTVHFGWKSEDGTQNERTLRFGDETSLGVFATLDGGPVFVLPRSVRDTSQTLLVNRATFPNNSEAWTALELEARGRTLRLERRGERFVVLGNATFPPDRLMQLLDSVADLRADAAIHVGAAQPAEGFAKPVLTLRLTARVGPPQTVSFGAGDSWRSTSVFYMRAGGVDATFVVAQSKVRAVSDAL